MTEATLIPASDQVQLMLDSPMTDGEQQQLAAIEARAASSAGKITINKIEMAQCCWRSTTTSCSRQNRWPQLGRVSQVSRFWEAWLPNEITPDTATVI